MLVITYCVNFFKKFFIVNAIYALQTQYPQPITKALAQENL